MKFTFQHAGFWTSAEGYALHGRLSRSGRGYFSWSVLYPGRFFSTRSYPSLASARRHAERHFAKEAAR